MFKNFLANQMRQNIGYNLVALVKKTTMKNNLTP